MLVGQLDLVVVPDDGHRVGQRLEHPEGDAAVVRVRSEHGMGMPVLAVHDEVELTPVDGGDGGGHAVPILSIAVSGMCSQPGRLRAS